MANKTMADLYKTDKATWEYISVPEENVLGEVHADIVINTERFRAGQTYLVPKLVAETVRERLKTYQRSCMRIMSPKKDTAAEQAVAVGSANATVPVVADASLIQ